MPLQAIAINNFNTPLMKQTTHADELQQRLTDLYHHDSEHHQFDTGIQAIAHFQQSFDQGHRLYVGMFNDKPICAIGCFDQDNNYRLDQLAMHMQNKHRGIEEQFIKLILQENHTNLTKFCTTDANIEKILKKLRNYIKSA